MALDSNLALQQEQREQTKFLPFSYVTKYYPAVPNLKQVIMNNWSLIRQQPLLRINIEIHPGMQSCVARLVPVHCVLKARARINPWVNFHKLLQLY